MKEHRDTLSISQEDEPEFSSSFSVGKSFRHLLGQWKILLIAGIAGLLLGLTIAFLKPTTYTASINFVVEESKLSGGGGLMSALTGQMGIDVSGLLGGSGMLSGDNIMGIVKSHTLIKKTLLTPYNSTGNYSLADRYADIYGWKEKWKNSSKVGRQINFPVGGQSFTRLEDSLLHRIIKQLDEDEMSIGKPNKRLTVFALDATTRDEQLSQLFCERLLKNTADFYIDTKIRTLKDNVNRLQKRSDSLEYLLNRKTYSASAASQMLLNGNPAFTSPNVTAEISSREKMVAATVYGEIVKNLEISKTALIQQTPTVNIVDRSEMPLERHRIPALLGMVAGFILGLGITAFCIFLFKK